MWDNSESIPTETHTRMRYTRTKSRPDRYRETLWLAMDRIELMPLLCVKGDDRYLLIVIHYSIYYYICVLG